MFDFDGWALLLCILSIILVFAVPLGILYAVIQLFNRCPKHLRWHLLTAIVWSMLLGVQTILRITLPEYAPATGNIVVFVAGCVVIASWKSLVEQWRGSDPTKKSVRMVRLFRQTLWGPIALWAGVLFVMSLTQKQFEMAVRDKNLPTALFLKRSGMANVKTEPLRAGLNNAIREQDASAVAIYLAVGTPTGECLDDSCGYMAALETAVSVGNCDIVEMLLKNGDSANTTSFSGSDSMLHHAVRNGDLEMVRVLLKHDANRRAYDGEGKTPFQVAKKLGNKEIIALLASPMT